MYLSQKHISRRMVLRGIGATVALPFLDAMVPVRAAAKAAGGAVRLVCIEMVHGSAGAVEYGAKQNFWSPASVGRSFDVSPGALSPLEPYADYLTLISNTDVKSAEAFDASEIGADHVRSCATTFTQTRLKHTRGADVEAGVSLEQLHARRFGQDTPIPSLSLCIDDAGAGCSSFGYSCVYQDTISWATPTTPLPMVRDPRVVFDQLFGGGSTPADRARRRAEERSILDTMTAAVARLSRELGGADRQRLTRYLDDIREIERRIQRVEAYNSSGETRELPDSPIGVPDSFSEHVKLMFDLQALAFASDLTRVSAFKLARDASSRAYPESGVKTGFHPTSHHGYKDATIAEFMKINRYHVGQLPYFLDKLKSITDGDANLLENTMIVWASPMADSQAHSHRRCPLFVMGHAGGRLKGHVHLSAPEGTPMANVFVSLLQTLGHDTAKFGDSTGAFDLSTVPQATAAANG